MCFSQISYLYFICYTFRFNYICMYSCRRNLNPGLFSIIEHNPFKSKLDRSRKHKIKLTSKSCRRFLYTILAVLAKVRLNLGLLGKKLIILQSVIRIEGISYSSQTKKHFYLHNTSMPTKWLVLQTNNMIIYTKMGTIGIIGKPFYSRS